MEVWHTSNLRPLRLGEEKRRKKKERKKELDMWANAQRDGRPVEYTNIFEPSVQRRKVWLTPTTRVRCSNAAKTRNPLKLARVPQTRQQISAVTGRKFTILRGHVEKLFLFNNFFSDCRYMP